MSIEEQAEAYADSQDRRGTGVWQGMYRGFIAGARSQAAKILLPVNEQQIIDAFNQGYREGTADIQSGSTNDKDVSQFDDAKNYFTETFEKP